MPKKPENPFQTVTSQKIANIAKITEVSKIAKITRLNISKHVWACLKIFDHVWAEHVWTYLSEFLTLWWNPTTTKYVAVKISHKSLRGQKKLGVGSHGGKFYTYRKLFNRRLFRIKACLE